VHLCPSSRLRTDAQLNARRTHCEMEYFATLADKVVLVLTLDGRSIVGLLRGSDPMGNIVLQDSHERIFSTDRGMEQEPLGLYIVRGDSV
jgi:U6 snRNA-associated Sm-like protein LSm8